MAPRMISKLPRPTTFGECCRKFGFQEAEEVIGDLLAAPFYMLSVHEHGRYRAVDLCNFFEQDRILNGVAQNNVAEWVGTDNGKSTGEFLLVHPEYEEQVLALYEDDRFVLDPERYLSRGRNLSMEMIRGLSKIEEEILWENTVRTENGTILPEDLCLLLGLGCHVCP